MYSNNLQKLEEIANIVRVAKSKWQTKDGKWWTNDGGGKKPYNPKAGGAPLTSSGMRAQSQSQASQSDATRARRKEVSDKLSSNPHMGAEFNRASEVPKGDNTAAAASHGATKPAHTVKNVKFMNPKAAHAMYKQHLDSDPEFAKHESERVGNMMGTGKASLSELHESIDKTDPQARHRDINEAYSSYHAKKNSPA